VHKKKGLPTNQSIKLSAERTDGTGDGVPSAKPEIVAMVGGSRHVETLRTADPIHHSVNLAARSALVKDGDALSNAFARVHCCEGGIIHNTCVDNNRGTTFPAPLLKGWGYTCPSRG